MALPDSQPPRLRSFTSNDDQAERFRQTLADLRQFSYYLMPEGRGKIQNRNAPLAAQIQKKGDTAQHGFATQHQRGSAGQRSKDLFHADIEADRRKLQQTITGSECID